jgi:hypothetical protein
MGIYVAGNRNKTFCIHNLGLPVYFRLPSAYVGDPVVIDPEVAGKDLPRENIKTEPPSITMSGARSDPATVTRDLTFCSVFSIILS